ncbi:MAG: DNA recombination protein RmuC [Planctomycetota bacterium]|nr:DNA recombination protein RmuC [Planctomycetota bacterium]
MDAITVMLGAVVVLLAVVCGWLLMVRSSLLAQLAGAEEARLARDEELTRVRSAEATLQEAVERARGDVERLSVEAATVRERLSAAEAARAAALRALEAQHRVELEARDAAAREREQELEKRAGEMRELFTQTIRTTAGDALRQSVEQFSKRAEHEFTLHRERARAELDSKIVPIAETLKRADEKLAQLEKDRTAAFASITETLGQVARGGAELRQETSRLVRALSRPDVRGRYGEVQLERVLELTGMRCYCDFEKQASSRDGEGTLRRPDVVVRLPNGRCVVIDAKANLGAYVDAHNATSEEERESHMERFARHVEEQAAALSKKEYAAHLERAADFVVMFIPGDQFVDAALARRPALLDFAAERRVILASPSTLIGLLSAIYVGWREKGLSDRAEELFTLGRELHQRAATAFEHLNGLGEAIGTVVRRYNDHVGSLEGRVMPQLRKLEEAGAKGGAKELPEVRVVEGAVRAFKLGAGAATASGQRGAGADGGDGAGGVGGVGVDGQVRRGT